MKKALFLDIDGTVIYDPGYVYQSSQIVFLPHTIQALQTAQELGFFLLFISNKGGAFYKKHLTSSGLVEIDMVFKAVLQKHGITFKQIATYYCPHYPQKDGPCDCRKPAAGLFKKAIQEHDIDASQSITIGDKVSDLIPGAATGQKEFYLVKRNQKFYEKEDAVSFPYIKKPDLLSVVKEIKLKRV
jgi:D-glycero-D-manno-heptose 1,7-bisphosphate phosphatase